MDGHTTGFSLVVKGGVVLVEDDVDLAVLAVVVEVVVGVGHNVSNSRSKLQIKFNPMLIAAQ